MCHCARLNLAFCIACYTCIYVREKTWMNDRSIHFGTTRVFVYFASCNVACFLNGSGERKSADASLLRWLCSWRASLCGGVFFHSRLGNLGKCFRFCSPWILSFNVCVCDFERPTVGSGHVLTVVCTFWHWSLNNNYTFLQLKNVMK